MYMCVCVCSYVCVAAFDWQHTQDAPDGAPSVRDESICLQGSNMCSVLHFYLWRSCSSHAAIPFFCWKENGLWKAIQQQEQQQQQQRELQWKILSSEKKIWNVHYSWQIFALTFCFLSVNFCLPRFLFFYVLFSQCMLLATRLTRPPTRVSTAFDDVPCVLPTSQPAWLHVWLNAFVAFRRACLFVGLFAKHCEECTKEGERGERWYYFAA